MIIKHAHQPAMYVLTFMIQQDESNCPKRADSLGYKATTNRGLPRNNKASTINSIVSTYL